MPEAGLVESSSSSTLRMFTFLTLTRKHSQVCGDHTTNRDASLAHLTSRPSWRACAKASMYCAGASSALLLGGQAMSGLGDRMVAVALAFAVLEIGGSVSEVGLVLAAGMVPLVGRAGGRRGRRPRVTPGRDGGRRPGAGGEPGRDGGAADRGAAEVWMLALLAGVTGAATGFFSPASTGLLPEVVPRGAARPANALRSSAIRRRDPGPGRSPACSWPAPGRAGRSPSTPPPSRPARRATPLGSRPATRAPRLLPDRPARRLADLPLAPVALDLHRLLRGGQRALGCLARARADRRPRDDLGGAAGWGTVLGGGRGRDARRQPDRDPGRAGPAVAVRRARRRALRAAAGVPGGDPVIAGGRRRGALLSFDRR